MRHKKNGDGGLASSVIGYFVILIAAAIVWSLIDPAFTKIHNATKNYTNTTAGNETVALTQTIWDGALIYILVLAIVFLIARAVFEGRVGGGF